MKSSNEELIALISGTANKRFIVVTEGEPVINLLKELAPTSLETSIVRLQRIATSASGWRTIIIASFGSIDTINEALQWSAYCKEELLDPESSDLYLILIVRDPQLTIEECVSYEANEKFCRKFILRPGESLESLLKRTFLLEINEEASVEAILDPLTIALVSTEGENAWFNSNEQIKWREQLLLCKSGQELIEKLFAFPRKTQE